MKTKRILSAVMAVMLAVSMTACGEKGNDKNENDKKKSSADMTTTITTPTETTTTAPVDKEENTATTTTHENTKTEKSTTTSGTEKATATKEQPGATTTTSKKQASKTTTTTTKKQVTTTTTAKKPEETPSKEVVLDVEPMGQGGLFESGSGIMAAKMVLDYYNVDMDPFYFCDYCMKSVGYQVFDVTPWEVCVGDPKTQDTMYYAPVIKNAINTYLQNKGISNLKAKDITGCTPEDIYKYVQNGKPIIVVANKRMRDFAESGISWTLPNGEEFVWKVDTSYWVVIGTSSSEVIVINANTGREKTYEKEKFEKSFIAYESQAILVE